jgi:pantoate--beta-alanine ligase
MKTLTTIAEMKAAVRAARAEGKTVGFVPTMGFLHEGHLSLVRASKSKSGLTVVSVFVNPTQFGPQEDFKTYPRDLARDAAMLEKEGVDILFNPEAGAMYPEGYGTYVEVQGLQDRLCGASRPSHFRGVCTVVLKLFEIVRPDVAYFGRKDVQQVIVLTRMVQDLDLDVRIDVRPIVREADGLAMSSRNTYLNPAERQAALVLIRSLRAAGTWIAAGERRAATVVAGMREMIGREPLARIDYVEAVDAADLGPVETIEDGTLIALAVFIGKTRLIDNAVVGPEGKIW